MLSKIYKFKLFSILSYYLARTAKNHFATGDYVKIYTSLLCINVRPKKNTQEIQNDDNWLGNTF